MVFLVYTKKRISDPQRAKKTENHPLPGAGESRQGGKAGRDGHQTVTTNGAAPTDASNDPEKYRVRSPIRVSKWRQGPRV